MAIDSTKRVWVEQKVINSSDFIPLQDAVKATNPSFFAYSLDRLHMTIFHFGVPQQLYNEFKQEVPKLTYPKFSESLEQLLLGLAGLVGTETSQRLLGVDTLGAAKSPKVGVIVERTKGLDTLRNRAMTGVLEMLHFFGVQKAEEFMQRSKNLRYSMGKNYIPHITIGSLNDHAGKFRVTPIALESVRLSPSSISNFDESEPIV